MRFPLDQGAGSDAVIRPPLLPFLTALTCRNLMKLKQRLQQYPYLPQAIIAFIYEKRFRRGRNTNAYFMHPCTNGHIGGFDS